MGFSGCVCGSVFIFLGQRTEDFCLRQAEAGYISFDIKKEGERAFLFDSSLLPLVRTGYIVRAAD